MGGKDRESTLEVGAIARGAMGLAWFADERLERM
jgi:hypothetical protein